MFSEPVMFNFRCQGRARLILHNFCKTDLVGCSFAMNKLSQNLVLARSRASDLENVRKLNCWYVLCDIVATQKLLSTTTLAWPGQARHSDTDSDSRATHFTESLACGTVGDSQWQSRSYSSLSGTNNRGTYVQVGPTSILPL